MRGFGFSRREACRERVAEGCGPGPQMNALGPWDVATPITKLRSSPRHRGKQRTPTEYSAPCPTAGGPARLHRTLSSCQFERAATSATIAAQERTMLRKPNPIAHFAMPWPRSWPSDSSISSSATMPKTVARMPPTIGPMTQAQISAVTASRFARPRGPSGSFSSEASAAVVGLRCSVWTGPPLHGPSRRWGCLRVRAYPLGRGTRRPDGTLSRARNRRNPAGGPCHVLR